jgi:hypothetical protein
MILEPLTITINAVPFTLARVQSGSVLNATPSVYQTVDEKLTLTVTNQKTKGGRVRHLIRLDVRELVTDPITSVTDWDSVSYTWTIDRPVYGFTVTQVDQHLAALKAWSTTAIITKIYGNES